MKKIVSILLILAMLLSTVPFAFAAGDDEYFDVSFDKQEPVAGDAVSYTHLTLPTKA